MNLTVLLKDCCLSLASPFTVYLLQVKYAARLLRFCCTMDDQVTQSVPVHQICWFAKLLKAWLCGKLNLWLAFHNLPHRLVFIDAESAYLRRALNMGSIEGSKLGWHYHC